jgi:hypothetical protein
MDPAYDKENCVLKDVGKPVILPGDVEVAEMTDVQDSMAIDPIAERRLVWKLDIHIIPILALMYMFNTLDRSNMGNAETDGLSKDLGLVGDQYNILLSVSLMSHMESREYYSRILSLSIPNAWAGLLRPLRCVSTVRGPSWQEVRPCSSPPNHDVHLWFHDTFNRRRPKFWRIVCSALARWYGRKRLLPAGHLLSGSWVQNQRSCSSSNL